MVILPYTYTVLISVFKVICKELIALGSFSLWIKSMLICFMFNVVLFLFLFIFKTIAEDSIQRPLILPLQWSESH